MSFYRFFRRNAQPLRVLILLFSFLMLFMYIRRPSEDANHRPQVQNARKTVQKLPDIPRNERVHENEVVLKLQKASQVFINKILPNGQFENAMEDFERYDLRVHCETLLSMLELLKVNPDEDLKKAVHRSSSWLLRQIGDVSEWPETRAIFSQKKKADTSVNGLCIVALTEASSVFPAFIAHSDLVELGKFLEMMMESDGSFHSYYVQSASSSINLSTVASPQASLALVKLSEKTRDRKWFDIAIKSLDYVIRATSHDSLTNQGAAVSALRAIYRFTSRLTTGQKVSFDQFAKKLVVELENQKDSSDIGKSCESFSTVIVLLRVQPASDYTKVSDRIEHAVHSVLDTLGSQSDSSVTHLAACSRFLVKYHFASANRVSELR